MSQASRRVRKPLGDFAPGVWNFAVWALRDFSVMKSLRLHAWHASIFERLDSRNIARFTAF